MKYSQADCFPSFVWTLKKKKVTLKKYENNFVIKIKIL